NPELAKAPLAKNCIIIPMSELPLSGRVALVTGGGTGIGRATALALARAGADVGIHYHSSEAGAQAARKKVVATGRRGFLLHADLTVEKQAIFVVDRLVDVFGRLDTLFNNAGSPIRHAPIEECPTDLWRQVLDVNVTSAFFITRRAIPHLRSGGHGSII